MPATITSTSIPNKPAGTTSTSIYTEGCEGREGHEGHDSPRTNTTTPSLNKTGSQKRSDTLKLTPSKRARENHKSSDGIANTNSTPSSRSKIIIQHSSKSPPITNMTTEPINPHKTKPQNSSLFCNKNRVKRGCTPFTPNSPTTLMGVESPLTKPAPPLANTKMKSLTNKEPVKKNNRMNTNELLQSLTSLKRKHYEKSYNTPNASDESIINKTMIPKNKTHNAKDDNPHATTSQQKPSEMTSSTKSITLNNHATALPTVPPNVSSVQKSSNTSSSSSDRSKFPSNLPPSQSITEKPISSKKNDLESATISGLSPISQQHDNLTNTNRATDAKPPHTCTNVFSDTTTGSTTTDNSSKNTDDSSQSSTQSINTEENKRVSRDSKTPSNTTNVDVPKEIDTSNPPIFQPCKDDQSLLTHAKKSLSHLEMTITSPWFKAYDILLRKAASIDEKRSKDIARIKQAVNTRDSQTRRACIERKIKHQLNFYDKYRKAVDEHDKDILKILRMEKERKDKLFAHPAEGTIAPIMTEPQTFHPCQDNQSLTSHASASLSHLKITKCSPCYNDYNILLQNAAKIDQERNKDIATIAQAINKQQSSENKVLVEKITKSRLCFRKYNEAVAKHNVAIQTILAKERDRKRILFSKPADGPIAPTMTNNCILNLQLINEHLRKQKTYYEDTRSFFKSHCEEIDNTMESWPKDEVHSLLRQYAEWAAKMDSTLKLIEREKAFYYDLKDQCEKETLSFSQNASFNMDRGSPFQPTQEQNQKTSITKPTTSHLLSKTNELDTIHDKPGRHDNKHTTAFTLSPYREDEYQRQPPPPLTIPTQDNIKNDEYPIYLEVFIQQSRYDNNLPTRRKSHQDVICSILANVLLQIEKRYQTKTATISECILLNNMGRNRYKKDNYPRFRIRLIPSSAQLALDECNNIIQILDDYFSSSAEGALKLQPDKNLHEEASQCVRFLRFSLPILNNTANISSAMIIGIQPSMHGRHHLACRWILKELHMMLKDFIPHEESCHHFALFRCKFGVRAGYFTTPLQRYDVYHIHTTCKSKSSILINALKNYTKKYKKAPKIFQTEIEIDTFPEVRNNGVLYDDLCRRLENTKKSLQDLRRIRLDKPFAVKNTSRIVSQVKNIKGLKTFSFHFCKTNFIVNIYFKKDEDKAMFASRNYQFITEASDTPSPTSTTSSTNFSFPSQSDINERKKRHLMRYCDKESSSKSTYASEDTATFNTHHKADSFLKLSISQNSTSEHYNNFTSRPNTKHYYECTDATQQHKIYHDLCPVKYHNSLKDIIKSGVSHNMILDVIKGWKTKEQVQPFKRPFSG